MIQIQKFTVNPFQENTYVLWDHTGEGVLSDPGCYTKEEEAVVVEFVKENKIQIGAILHTHSHLDHCFATGYFSSLFNVDVWIHNEDIITYNAFEKVCSMYGVPIKHSLPETYNLFSISDGFVFGNSHLEIRFVPGHAPGHVVFYAKEEEFVVNGDCLFYQSIGRTDLPGGDHGTLLSSIREELFTLPMNTTVYCGHGPETTIGNEVKTNPFLN